MWLTLALFACAPHQAELDALAEQNVDLETRLAELETRNADLESRLASAEATVESWDTLLSLATRSMTRDPDASEQTTPPRPAPTPTETDDPAASCTLIEKDRYQLTAPVDPTAHASSARATTHLIDGEPQGLKIVGVRGGSIFATCGFRSGDIVLSIGGMELNGVSSAMTAYQELTGSPEVTVEVIRRGQPKTWQILAPPGGTETGGTGH